MASSATNFAYGDLAPENIITIKALLTEALIKVRQGDYEESNRLTGRANYLLSYIFSDGKSKRSAPKIPSLLRQQSREEREHNLTRLGQILKASCSYDIADTAARHEIAEDPADKNSTQILLVDPIENIQEIIYKLKGIIEAINKLLSQHREEPQTTISPIPIYAIRTSFEPPVVA